jgi:ATP-binding cassette subfamily A (ABC1) protein 3
MDVENEMDEIRSSMGVCPQHDILFDDLTVREHLQLFANFKGMDPIDIPTAIEQAISDVDLKLKADDRAKNLSGGQRRRLSVAIAFIGNS